MQQALFHDSIFDAIGADVAACGGVKKVACKLWPTLEPTIAAARLRGCLNPEHAQKLCPDEVLAIKRLAKESGSFATVTYEAQQLGYKIEWLQPEDELTTLVTEVSEDFKRIETRQRRIEQLLQQMHDPKVRVLR